jgi:hypothetical protein
MVLEKGFHGGYLAIKILMTNLLTGIAGLN